jgi:hypothetical protein
VTMVDPLATTMITQPVSTELSGLDLHAGDHICAFYRGAAERDDILIPFLLGGLTSGGKCTCVVDSCSPDHVLRRLTAEIDAQSYVDHCQLEVLDSDETYFATGGFLPEQMLVFWETKALACRSDGSTVTRNIGDMSWAHRDKPGVEQLASYESELNRVMGNVPQINMCLYDLNRCGGELILDVLKTHPKAMLGGMIIDNPYYLEPDEFLATRAR